MRCLSCNKILTPFESSRKYKSGEYIFLCNHDLAGLGIETVDKDELYEDDLQDLWAADGEYVGDEELPDDGMPVERSSDDY